MAVRPPFAYFGGKTMIAPKIVRLFPPPHRHYVEPFAGSLSVLLAKPPSRIETVNDLDEHLVTFWRVLRDRPTELVRVCAMTPHSRLEHQRAFDLDVDDELERARRIWCYLSQGRTGTLRQTGWRYNVGDAGTASMPEYLGGYLGRMLDVAGRLRLVALECRPALELVELYGTADDVLLYVDPPYPQQVRTGPGAGYRVELQDDADHVELLDRLLACRAAVVLSGYACELYDRRLYEWDRFEISAATGQAQRGGPNPRSWQIRTEVLWSNRELQTVPSLFDHGPQPVDETVDR